MASTREDLILSYMQRLIDTLPNLITAMEQGNVDVSYSLGRETLPDGRVIELRITGQDVGGIFADSPQWD